MSYVRELLPRVSVYRPDLIEKEGEGYAIWALQEVIRCICRATFLNVVSLPVTPLLGNTHVTTLTVPGGEPSTIKKVVAAPLPGSVANPARYMGTLDVSTGIITPSYNGITTLTYTNAPSFPPYSFYLINTLGAIPIPTNVVSSTTSILQGALTTMAWDVGDTISSDGSNWIQYKLDKYKTLGVTSKVSIDKWFDTNQVSRGIPSHCSREFNSLYWYPPPQYDTVVQITLAVVPNSINWQVSPPQYLDMIVNPLPVEAEEAIINGTLEILYRTPGMHQDIKQAEMFRKRYEEELSGLKSMGIFGSSGDSFMVPPNWVGRQYSTGPYRNMKGGGGDVQ